MNIEWDDRELQQALNMLVEKMPEQFENAVLNAGLAIEAEAKERCPVNTGALRSSITTEVGKDGNDIVGYVGTTLEYAPYVHQGTGIYAREGNGRKDVPWFYFDEAKQTYVRTSGTKPTPFLEEARDAVQPHVLDYFTEVLRKCLN